jgi:hypothetical protein
MNKVINAISDHRIITAIILLFAIFASVQSYLVKESTNVATGYAYTHYNNYVIFKQSFNHLVENKDIYQAYPAEHWDLYKYSPTFSMFFGIFAILPDLIGLNLWNILNALIFLVAVYYLPVLSKTQKGWVLLISLIELMTSLQNSQSNALVAGLLILSFGLLERKHYATAAFCIVFSVFIKLFGILGMALFLFYPQKWKLLLYTAGWSLLFLVLPLALVDYIQLRFLYTSWGKVLHSDYGAAYGYSVMGWLHSWFGFRINQFFVVLAGIVAFTIPLVRFREYKNYIFRFLTLTSILIWVVIFNHMAESPTFIIAMAGASLWFVISEKNWLNITLVVCAMILTSLSSTDLFPQSLNDAFVKPYALKAFPCILIWLKVVYDMMVGGRQKTAVGGWRSEVR